MEFRLAGPQDRILEGNAAARSGCAYPYAV